MGVFRQQKAMERLDDRLIRLEGLCDDIERNRRKLDLEFTDLYDKVSRQMSRMAKRYAVDTKEKLNNEEPDLVDSPGDSLDPISRSIMVRRGMLGVDR